LDKSKTPSVTRNLTKKYISINDFTVNKIIGRGGFGKVLLVEKKDDGKLFAMKVIKKDMVAQRNQKIHTLA
jgi:serine/threonine protein kinase